MEDGHNFLARGFGMMLDFLPFPVRLEEGVDVRLMVLFQSLPVAFDLELLLELVLLPEFFLTARYVRSYAAIFIFFFLGNQSVGPYETLADADRIVELDFSELSEGLPKHSEPLLIICFELFVYLLAGSIQAFDCDLDLGELLLSGEPAFFFLVVVPFASAGSFNEGFEYAEIVLDVNQEIRQNRPGQHYPVEELEEEGIVAFREDVVQVVHPLLHVDYGV